MPSQSSSGVGTDSLFLLEVLVKDLHYSYSSINLDKNLLCSLLETCVLVKFLNYPPLEIRQDMTVPDLDYNASDVIMGTGKSCLFSLNKNVIMCNRKLNIVFNVVRMNPAGSRTKCVGMGKAVADLSKNFLPLMRKSCSSSNPTTKCLKETFPILNDQCQIIGNISVFMRLSCFGNQITTQFMMSSNERESFVFKGEDPKENINLPSECFNVDCNGEDDETLNSRCQGDFGGNFGSPWGQMPQMYQPQVDIPDTQYHQLKSQQMQLPPIQYPHMQTPQFKMPQMLAPQMQMPYQDRNGQSNGNFNPSPRYDQPYGNKRTSPLFRGVQDDRYQFGKPWAEKDDTCNEKTSNRPQCPLKLPRPPDLSGIKCLDIKDNSYESKNLKQKTKKKGKEYDDNNLSGIPSFPKDFPFCQRVTIGDVESSEEEESPVQEGHKLNLCDCDFPVPPGLLDPCPPPPIPKKKKKPPCPLDLQPGDYCLRSDCPCGLPMVPWMANLVKNENEEDVVDKKSKKRSNKSNSAEPEKEKFNMAPGSVGMKGKQILFQMNDREIPLTEADKKFMANTQYKIGTIGDTKGPQTAVQVIPGKIDSLDPTIDKDHDLFILKIGKKNEVQKKAKLQIELKTPKFEDKTPVKVDVETQWLDSDVPTAVASISPKVGKKTKGGKKGKKGKKK